MNERKRILLALLVSLVLWSIFTWPLPRHIATAIPFSAQFHDQNYISTMEPGDHLQYLYYLNLVKDMITGNTPLMYNLYEFNTGNDEDRFEPDPYYVPFSLLFTLIALAGNLALAWNLTGLISLWLTYWITWKLVRRFTDREWVAAIAALMTFALPVRWANLLGGSPMGLAMLWPPLVMYGLDVAIRENRVRGGIVAGLSILFALWTDMHVFFFSTLMVPAWCIVVFVLKEDFNWSRWSSYRSLALALLPVPIFLAAALGIRHLHTQDTALVAEASRKWTEAALFSPRANGLIEDAQGITGHIYIGWGVVVLLAIGLLASVLHALRGRNSRIHSKDVVTMVLLTGGIAVLILLSLGTYGPQGGKIFDLARKYMPFYSMIRQSGKIFCLLPPIIAVVSVIVYRMLIPLLGRGISTGVWLALTVWILVAGYFHVGVGLTWLNSRQAAYEAVSRDAATNHLRTGTVVIPLWPGDSHFASVYQLYAQEHHIRMVNGYSPIVPSRYLNEIFYPFNSINQGVLDDQQLNGLLARGIHYIILHQNMFPEKVSPFPVGFTIRNLINHPRLELLKQDERVWAFRILEAPVDRPAMLMDWTTIFSSVRQEAEWNSHHFFIKTNDITAGGMAFVSFHDTNGFVRILPSRVAKTPELAWLVRARGHGNMRATAGEPDHSPIEVALASDGWEWYRIPAEQKAEMADCGLRLDAVSGQADVDTMILVGGPWKSPATGETIRFSAARFFHGGYMDAATEKVMLEKAEDPIALIFYGPKLPFDPGTYEIELDFESSAEPGVMLGVINLEQDDLTGRGIPLNVIAGQPAKGTVDRADNLPFKIVFVYHGVADMQLDQVRITRLK